MDVIHFNSDTLILGLFLKTSNSNV
ncbi:NADPH oxidase 5, partial [Araneus ventricosus]